MITGCNGNNRFKSSLFDRNSFVKILGGWAQTVMVGWARLRGIPMGIITVEMCMEMCMVEDITPTDPANPDLIKQVVNEAGRVWYLNSTSKIA